ncbi:hypothetical protein INR49_005673 [Caranx melampygus]|nr:hypothetical protein INR49_005673 [Caranx melampygus]
MFVNAEEEFFYEQAIMKFHYSVQEEADSCLSGRWSFDDVPMKPFRTVMLIPADRMPAIMDKLKEYLTAVLVEDNPLWQSKLLRLSPVAGERVHLRHVLLTDSVAHHISSPCSVERKTLLDLLDSGCLVRKGSSPPWFGCSTTGTISPKSAPNLQDTGLQTDVRDAAVVPSSLSVMGGTVRTTTLSSGLCSRMSLRRPRTDQGLAAGGPLTPLLEAFVLADSQAGRLQLGQQHSDTTASAELGSLFIQTHIMETYSFSQIIPKAECILPGTLFTFKGLRIHYGAQRPRARHNRLNTKAMMKTYYLVPIWSPFTSSSSPCFERSLLKHHRRKDPHSLTLRPHLPLELGLLMQNTTPMSYGVTHCETMPPWLRCGYEAEELGEVEAPEVSAAQEQGTGTP